MRLRRNLFVAIDERPRDGVRHTIQQLAPGEDSAAVAGITDSLVETHFRPLDEVLEELPRQPEVVSDRNMITEYRYGLLGSYLQKYDSPWEFLMCMTCKKEGWEKDLD